jgi:rod shape-determining protein MreC
LLLGVNPHHSIPFFPQGKIISSANFFSGGVYERVNVLNEYLNLKTQNDALALENAQLKNLLFNRKDTTLVQKLDSIKVLKPNCSVKSDTQLL